MRRKASYSENSYAIYNNQLNKIKQRMIVLKGRIFEDLFSILFSEKK